MKRNFLNLIAAKFAQGKFVCVGLDPVWEELPEHLTKDKDYGDPKVIFDFCKAIINETKDIVACYKPNFVFFEAYGEKGFAALKLVCDYILQLEEEIPFIIDAKRADIGNTNLGSIKGLLEYFNADAITVNPYLGKVALEPFFERKNKWFFVLARTSNKGADEFQGLELKDGGKVYEKVIFNVENEWNAPNCGLVIGATTPQELKDGRKIASKRIILIPGVGAQGGDLQQAVQNGLNSEGNGILVNSSRAIIYASKGEDFARKARAATATLHYEIVDIRKKHLELITA